MTETVYDVAVVGGGPAGAAAAWTLARRGLSVALLESTALDTPRPGESLPPQVRPLLHALGIDDPDAVLPAIPNHANQSRWGDAGLHTASFIFDPYGHGWHLDRAAFDRLLFQRARAAGVDARLCTRLLGVDNARHEPVWRLAANDAQGVAGALLARGLIDAGGRRSTLWRFCGAQRRPLDRLVAIARSYRMAESQGGSTLVEACAEGWWYTAPLPQGRRIVMLMTDADLCHRAHLSGAAAWEACLAGCAATCDALVGGTAEGGPRVHAAHSYRLRREFARLPWLACGDAAMALDPLSSGGITQALRGGIAAADAMQAWLHGDAAPAQGYEMALDAEYAEYRRQRRSHYAMETRWPGSEFWRRRQRAEVDANAELHMPGVVAPTHRSQPVTSAST